MNFICGPEAAPGVGFAAHLFFVQMQTTDKIQETIEGRLATAEPEVEVLLAEQIGAQVHVESDRGTRVTVARSAA